jgi:hypothetical protein
MPKPGVSIREAGSCGQRSEGPPWHAAANATEAHAKRDHHFAVVFQGALGQAGIAARHESDAARTIQHAADN